MPFNTITVSGAIAPALISTYLSHYLNYKSLKKKPTAHISYHEGVELIREFLHHASHHTVEDIQAFTSQWVPSPRWVKVDEVEIPHDRVAAAATALERQLGPDGIRLVGGRTWWQWRKPESRLMAEWIEMRGDYNRRKKTAGPGNRVMLYVHGGAYFFGSVDEHRYQMQRHARKLKARVLARLLVILRDQGVPLPAGAILISPWVDLTHSFPSVAGDNPMDYIPPHGFLHRPSAAWPPPNSDDLRVIQAGVPTATNESRKSPFDSDAALGFSIEEETHSRGDLAPQPNHNLSIVIDGDLIEVKDQIQLYTTNQLLSHPLVSPVLQPSLGGLPPLLILTGGGEVLRDEQIYLAHKAANPKMYSPSESFLDLYPGSRDAISKWKGTDVQLQVWDDLCHVAPTLSFTPPAKHMYRSISQFGAWALARAQMTEIEILDDDDVSIISGNSDLAEANTTPNDSLTTAGKDGRPNARKIGKAGDALPPFHNHMIRQRVDCYGYIYALAPPSKLPALQVPPHEVGIIKEGPVRRWMAGKREWDTKFAREKRAVQKKRMAELAHGYERFGDEVPPPSALAGRRERGVETEREKSKSRSWGMSMWSLWGSKHDKATIGREEQADMEPEVAVVSPLDGAGANARVAPRAGSPLHASRSRSRRRAVTDAGQTGGPNDESLPLAPNPLSLPLQNHNHHRSPPQGSPAESATQEAAQVAVQEPSPPPSTGSVYDAGGGDEANGAERPFGPLRRPFFDGVAIPFTLRRLGDPQSRENRHASLITLDSMDPVDALQRAG